MGVRKIYQSLEFKSLDTYELVNGVKTVIQFRSGSLNPSAKGQFTTTNPHIIEAMDHSTSNGITFKCIHTETFDDGKELPAAPVIEAEPEHEPELAANEEPAEQVPDISTVQAARAYLVERFQIPISKLPNAASVRKAAAANKIEFIDLP